MHFRDETDRLTQVDVEAGYHLPPSGFSPKTILDLGCNAGYTIVDFAERFPGAQIWGVELDEENYLAAKKNTKHLPDVTIFHIGIASHEGTCSYNGDLANNCYSIGEGNRTAKCCTLDSFIEFCSSIDFAKFDIEGAERDIFKAGGEWTEKIKSLKAELHGSYSVEEAIADLQALGYEAEQGELHQWSVFAWR